jgi:hypothetical protein
MVPIGYFETSVASDNSTLCKIPEERRSHLNGGESLKSRTTSNISLFSPKLAKKKLQTAGVALCRHKWRVTHGDFGQQCL